jgi:heme a synthase
MTETRSNIWLHRYATFVATATLVLITAGALVTSNDAGLSVPDWPTSFGSFRMPRMVGGVFYEHGHRMIAGTVGVLTILLAAGLCLREPRRWVRWLGGAAVLAVLAQAVLGGITVLFYLPVAVSVAHATLGQIFFCLTVSIALFTRDDWHWKERPGEPPKTEDSGVPSLCHLTAATTVAILLQLILGAAFRHSGSGVTPHLVGAAIVTLLVGWVVARVLLQYAHERRLRRPALALLGLLAVQIFLGVGSLLMRLRTSTAPQPLPEVVAVTTTHVVVGALVLAASLVLTLEAFRALRVPGRAVEIARLPGRATI